MGPAPVSSKARIQQGGVFLQVESVQTVVALEVSILEVVVDWLPQSELLLVVVPPSRCGQFVHVTPFDDNEIPATCDIECIGHSRQLDILGNDNND